MRGPLHGLPVLVKDNIATGDRMSTTAGSLALDGMRAPRDAHVVERLRDAGAVILGKTNLSEWANIRSTRSTSGWSARGGLTRNPYALDRNTSGSSSGTAAAIAASLAPLGVGTETDGSIVSPASICGLVGLKPTVGRMSRDGIVPIAHTQDTPGPMARSVADAALLYAAMTGRDGADEATAAAPADGAPGDAIALPDDALRGARLGVARAYFTGFDEADALIEKAIVDLKRLGAEIVDPVDLALPSYIDAELRVLLHELKADLPKYLASFAPDARVKTLADVIAFNRAHQRTRDAAGSARSCSRQAEAYGGLDGKEYLDALAECRKGARDDGIDRVFKAHRLDALVAPTGGPAWLIDPVNGDHVGRKLLDAGRGRRATRISPCPRGSCVACRSACRSSARRGAKRGCWRSATPTRRQPWRASHQPSRSGRRRSERRSTQVRRRDCLVIARRAVLVAGGTGGFVLLASGHAEAQAGAKIPRIGMLWSTAIDDRNLARLRATFRERLAALGYVEGKTIVIEERSADGNLQRLDQLARELVASEVVVIVAQAVTASVAAHRATQTIPIVMVNAGDAVGAGLITSLARPGGNVTGTTNISFGSKQVELIHELVPRATRLAVLLNPTNANAPRYVADIKEAGRHLNLGVVFAEVRQAEDFATAFATIRAGRPDGLLVMYEPLISGHRDQVIAFAAGAGLPTTYDNAVMVRDGGLVSYGPVYAEHWTLAAGYVDKILKGARPASLPVEQPMRFELIINLKTARALGLAIPQSVIVRAEELIP